MNKQELTQSMKSKYGDFLTLNEIAEFLKIDRSTARQWVYGLEFLPCGRAKKFYVSDIAGRLMERMEV